MHRGLNGYYVPISTVGETVRAFVPHDLPPEPPLLVDGEMGGCGGFPQATRMARARP